MASLVTIILQIHGQLSSKKYFENQFIHVDYAVINDKILMTFLSYLHGPL